MNQRQAKALLELVADLYILANIPEPLEPPVSNGQVKEPADAATEKGGRY